MANRIIKCWEIVISQKYFSLTKISFKMLYFYIIFKLWPLYYRDRLCSYFQNYLPNSILLTDIYYQRTFNKFNKFGILCLDLLRKRKKTKKHLIFGSTILTTLPEDNQHTSLSLKRFSQFFPISLENTIQIYYCVYYEDLIL